MKFDTIRQNIAFTMMRSAEARSEGEALAKHIAYGLLVVFVGYCVIEMVTYGVAH